jgi:purine-binding chemotaxis protein CheW
MVDTNTLGHSQFLRFELDDQFYALDVLKTREVLSSVKITPLPSALDFLSGVINLRGSVIPVVDLRKKFGMAAVAPTPDTSIVIVEILSRGEKTVVGALVDAVKDVILCEATDLEEPPRFGMRLNANLIQSISKKNDEFVIILDSDKLFSEEELWLVQTNQPSETAGEEQPA